MAGAWSSVPTNGHVLTSNWGHVSVGSEWPRWAQLRSMPARPKRDHKRHRHTHTDRIAMPGSMGPWAGLKRCCIREACRSSLMSNLPHQKTFIPINMAVGEGTVCCLSTTPTSVSLSALPAGDMLVFVHCACQIQGFLSKLCTNKAGCYVFFRPDACAYACHSCHF